MTTTTKPTTTTPAEDVATLRAQLDRFRALFVKAPPRFNYDDRYRVWHLEAERLYDETGR